MLNDIVEKLCEVIRRGLRHVLKLKARAIVNRGYLKAGGFLDSSLDGFSLFIQELLQRRLRPVVVRIPVPALHCRICLVYGYEDSALFVLTKIWNDHLVDELIGRSKIPCAAVQDHKHQID